MRRWAGLAALALSGCTVPYADFRLPKAEGPAGRPVNWQWSREEKPQIERGDWDRSDVLNPVVLRVGGTYFNFYSGFDGQTLHTALATSADGRAWTKQGKVMSPQAGTWEDRYIAANGSVRRVGEEFFHWYQAGPMGRTRIGLARSRDGKTWRRETAPVLDYGPRGAWDEISLGDPDVVVADGQFYLFYLGEDRARRQRLGVARSADGVHWLKLRANPLLELGEAGAFDENGLGEPAVWAARGAWWMLYTGRDRGERRRMGLARSDDGVKWTKVARPLIAGEQEWDHAVVCDASVIADGDRVKVWFGGGRVAHPAERIDGMIGFGVLEAR